MSWQQLKAVLWLRLRLSLNQLRRGGTLSAVFSGVIIVLVLISSMTAFLISLLGGVFALKDASPVAVMILWDSIAGAFLICWMIGLMTDLQRSESLALDKLLHFPLALGGVIVLNYLSSLVSFTLVLFLPAMLGIGIALIILKGPTLLVVFPLIASFILMITAATYLFRGWLATLMVNKRRRRTILALLTVCFILVAQLPSLINLIARGGKPDHQLFQDELQELNQLRSAEEITEDEFADRFITLQAEQMEQRKAEKQRHKRKALDLALTANAIIPLGWLPYGVRAAVEGSPLAGVFGSLGGLLIGAVFLWRSHRVAVRFYRGGFQSKKRRRKPVALTSPVASGSPFLEKKLPWFSEHATVIALANFRSLIRAPEAKMIMLTPIILITVFGSMMYAGGNRNLPDLARPWLALGALLMTMFALVQLCQNLFGFDRNGFRVFVLSPAPRREILLGKNLSLAPIAIGLCAVSLIGLELIFPLRISDFLATFVQSINMYLILCLIGNSISIAAPMAMSTGSLKPAKPNIKVMLVHIMCTLLFPLAMLPVGVPPLADLLLDLAGWRGNVPVYLLLALVELVLLIWIYRRVITAQGRWLVQRERAILQAVIAPVE